MSVFTARPEPPSARLAVERAHLQSLASTWRGDTRAARPLATAAPVIPASTVFEPAATATVAIKDKLHRRAHVDLALRALPHTGSPNLLAVYAALLADIDTSVNGEGARL